MTPYYSDPLVTLYLGDCLEVMRELPDASVDSAVTDPPYGLEFMGKEWDRLSGQPGYNERGRMTPASSGLVKSKGFDRIPNSFQAGKPMQDWHRVWATEAFRVLKPGGYLLAFGGTRTVHRLASAIEDAGFEIRDELVWVYASGFPKSLDVSKAIDKAAGAEREVVGTAADFARDGANRKTDGSHQKPHAGQGGHGYDSHWATPITAPATDLARKWEGWGTALKPAHEPIVMARKPLIGTVASNVSRYGVGALNIDGTRIPSEPPQRAMSDPANRTGGVDMTTWAHLSKEDMQARQNAAYDRQEQMGRWPSNVLLSSPELFDEPNPGVVGSGATTTSGSRSGEYDGSGAWSGPFGPVARDIEGDAGGYSRFFIVPKSDRAERERGLQGKGGDASGRARANVHPT